MKENTVNLLNIHILTVVNSFALLFMLSKALLRCSLSLCFILLSFGKNIILTLFSVWITGIDPFLFIASIVNYSRTKLVQVWHDHKG